MTWREAVSGLRSFWAEMPLYKIKKWENTKKNRVFPLFQYK